MIVTFVLGALAAWGAPQVEPQVRMWLAKVLPVDDIPPVEMRGITLALSLFVAAVLAALMDSESAVALALGAVVGALGPRTYQKFKTSKAPDYDS